MPKGRKNEAKANMAAAEQEPITSPELEEGQPETAAAGPVPEAESEVMTAETEGPAAAESGQEDELKALREKIAALEQALSEKQQPQIVQISQDTERVEFLWQAEVAEDNVQTFGEGGMFGRIVGRTGSFYVPKRDFSRLLDEKVRYFLDKRWLIVVSGLSEDEREALGVNYREGEVLDKAAFSKMVELGDEILRIYPRLCEGHRKMVAQRYREAFQNGSAFVTRERVTRLNELSRQMGSPKGEFISILEAMNRAEANG